MADYLALRRSLSGVVLMIDPRLGLTDLDRQLLAWWHRGWAPARSSCWSC
jgi:GTP-binding protein